MIHCYRVSIKKHSDNLSINSQTLPSFFLASGGGRDIPGMLITHSYKCAAKSFSINFSLDLKITHLKWTNIEDSDALLVGTKCTAGCFLELWSLVEKATPIHSHFKHMFQQPNKAEVFKTLVNMKGHE